MRRNVRAGRDEMPRRRPFRRLVTVLLVLLAIVVGAGIAAQLLVDRAAVKEQVIAAVKAQTGRDLTIGALSIQVFPWPGFVARDVRVSGEGDDAPLLIAGQMRGTIGVLPLFHRDVQIEHLVAAHGRVSLRRDSAGQANWMLAGRASEGVPDGTLPSHRPGLHITPVAMADGWHVTITSIVLSDIGITYENAQGHNGGHAQVTLFDADGLETRTPRFTLKGQHDKATFSVVGHVGPLAALMPSPGVKSAPWAVSLDGTLQAEGSVADRLRFDGTVANVAALTGISGTVDGAVAHLDDVEALFPHANLPDMEALSGTVAFSNLSVGSDGIDLPAAIGSVDRVALKIGIWSTSRHMTLRDLSLDADALTAPLVVKGRAAFGAQEQAITASFGTLQQARDALKTGLQSPMPVMLTLKSAGSSAGEIALKGDVGRDAAHLDLNAHADKLTFPHVLFDHVSIEGHLDIPEPVSVALSNARPYWRHALQSGSGQVALTVASLAYGEQHYTDIKGTATLDDHALTVDPLEAKGPVGAIRGALHISAAQTPVTVSIQLNPAMLPAVPLQHWAGIPQLLKGPVEVVGDLHARGDDRDALLASLTGHLGLSMVGGAVNGHLLGQYLGREASHLLGHGDIGMRCLGVHMLFNGGAATLDTIGLQAGALSVSGRGDIGLRDQVMTLHIVPRVGLGAAGASTPVMVTGTPGSPKVTQEAGADGRYHIAIGGGAPDPCAAALPAAREGHEGAPAPAPHHSKAEGILHALGLFR